MPPPNSIENTLTGIIYNEHDAPLAGVKIEAYKKRLRNSKLLGEALTDAEGQYSIQYDSHRGGGDGIEKTTDIFIRIIIGASDSLEVLGESPVYYNVEDDLKLDYKIDCVLQG